MSVKLRSGRWMVVPGVLVVLAIIIYPLAFATYYSFRLVRPGLAGEWVGLANYAGMLRDPDFSEALLTNLIFTVASAGLSFLIGLGLALLLSRPFPGRGAVAAAVFLPWVFPVVATATFGRLALFEGSGIVSGILQVAGISDAEILLLDRNALLSVAIILDMWRTAPFVALLLLAGLRTIPEDIYEAASLDGANSLQRFFKITLPLLKPVLLVVLLIRILDALRVFDLFRVLGDQNLGSLSTYVYQNVLLSQLNFGLGNAAAVFMFACALAVSLLFVLILRRQASTGLAHAGLYGDADAALATPGSDRTVLPLGVAGGLLAIVFLVPPVWVFWVSIAFSPDEWGGQVTGPSLLSYPFALFDGRIVAGLLNSCIIAGITTFLTLILACPTAYAVARLGLRYANGLLAVLLAVAFFPPVAVLVPMLVQLREIGIIGTHLGAIVPHTVFFLPFAIWLLATFFRELPDEIEDAAKVDGARQIQVLTRVIVPLAAPAVVATGAFVFVLSWNELIFAATFTLSESVRPVTVILADLVAEANAGFSGPLAAASLVVALPPLVLFLVFRRRILAGLTGSVLGEAQPTELARRSSSAALRRLGELAASAVLLASGVWAATLFVRHGLAALGFPYPLNYGEGPLLDQAVRLADLYNIYPTDLSEPPYTIANYPPLFVLLQMPFVWVFGPELWYGRAISLASTAAVAALISLTLHALTRDKIASAAGGLLFLAFPFVLHWSSLARVDMLGLALAWAGLCVVVRRPDRRWAIFLAGLLMVAAIYTRQTYALAPPLAAFIWLLALRRPRGALTLAVVVGGTSLVLLAVLSALTDQGFFFHTVTSNVNEFRWEQVTFYLAELQALMPILLVGAGTFVIVGLRSRAGSYWFVGAYLLGGIATASLVGKVGSDVNYLLELCVALSLAAGALLARYAARPGVRAAMLVALAVQVVLMVQTSQFYYADLQARVIAHREEMAQLAATVRTSEGPVLTDEQMALLPLNGRRIYIQPFEFSQLSREGKWDQQPFVEAIQRAQFEAILIFEPQRASGLVEDRWTPRMLREIEARYEPAETVADTKVFRPR